MNTNNDVVKKIQLHDYAGNVANTTATITITPNKTVENKDLLEVCLANHIEAFCDCV